MGFKKRLSDALELPEYIVLGQPLLHLTGGRLVVENHKGVAEFDGVHVRIRCGSGSVLVQGEKLHVGSIGRDDIVITGVIRSVAMEG